MPIVGFGLWKARLTIPGSSAIWDIPSYYCKRPPSCSMANKPSIQVTNETCADTVYNAIKAGYRLFDGAVGERI